MKESLKPYLEQLKAAVLKAAGLQQMVTADCERLASAILKKTGTQVSDTTLKRFFGFANCIYAPSAFTLNTLCIYCGFTSWSHFLQQSDSQVRQTDVNTGWTKIAQAAHAITQFTINSNRHSCGISYVYTIERKAIHEHIQSFLHSGCTACVLSAPAGAGKTIGMTNWVDKRLAERDLTHANDIYLYLNSASLFFAAGFGINSDKWLSHLLNLPENKQFEEFIQKFEKVAPGNFYLIIDDFNDNAVKERHFDMVFNQLIDMVSYLSKYSWIKIVVMLRPSTWQKYGLSAESPTGIRDLWFTNFINSKQDDTVNLPDFDRSEVHELISRINGIPPEDVKYPEKYFQVIRYPLNFQYYCSLNENKFPTDLLNFRSEYAIAELYLNKNVLNSVLAEEKTGLLQKIISEVKFKNGLAYADKKDLLNIIRENRRTYTELLHTGIIREYNKRVGSRITYQVRFRSVVVAVYFKASRELQKHLGERMLPAIKEWLSMNNMTEDVKMAVLKWLIISQTETGNLDILETL